MKTEVDKDRDIWRQTHSGVEQCGNSLSADDYPRVTKMEADEEEDRCTLGSSKVAAPFQLMTTPEWRKWRQMKKTDALWGLAKRQLPFSWQLPQSDEDRTWYLTSYVTPDSRAHGGCSSLCSPRSSRTTPVASFLILLSVKCIAMEHRQSPQVVPTGLTED